MKALEMPHFLSTLDAASDNPFNWGKTANPGVSFCSRLFFSFSNFVFLLFPSGYHVTSGSLTLRMVPAIATETVR